jgi:hypothetical protein
MRIEAEDILGAMMERGWDESLVEALFEHLGLLEWRRVGGKAYPEEYALAAAYPANPAVVARMRREIACVPRVNPLDYEILFNAEGTDIHRPGPTWDIVKWVPMPEAQGFLPRAGGWLTVVLLEPVPVYSISAVIRPLETLGDRDFEVLRRNAITREGGRRQRQEIQESNEAKREALERQRADDDEMFGRELRPLVKRLAEEKGA